MFNLRTIVKIWLLYKNLIVAFRRFVLAVFFFSLNKTKTKVNKRHCKSYKEGLGRWKGWVELGR